MNLSFYPLLWQAGGTVFTEDAKDVAFDSEAGESALQLLVDLKKLGGLPADAATDASKVEGGPIATGKAAMRITTSLPELKQMRAALGAETVAFGPPMEGKEQATFGNPGLLALTSINKKENREAAYQVMSYLGSASVQNGLTAAAGSLPTRTDAAPTGQDPDAIAMAEALKSAHPGEPSPVARQVMAVLAPNIQAALRGDVTAKEALDRAAMEARGILQRSAS